MKVSNMAGRTSSLAPAATTTETASARHGAESTSLRTRNLHRAVDEHGICTLTFDRPNSSANVLDRDVLLELDSHLDWIERTSTLRGLIVASAKENIFVAGADVHALAGMADQPAPAPAQRSMDNGERDSSESPHRLKINGTLRELIQLGQGVFNRLASLHVPTVAAIHGACVGGGYELALACDYRLASDARATTIGLPEIKLGILPAWGGCTRLPRLIGIPKALEIILAGKTLAADRALKMGLIDEIAPRARLLELARERMLKPVKPHRHSVRVSNNPVSAALIRTRMTHELAGKTRGNYPAPFEALDVVTRSVSLPLERSLANERDAILRLANSVACHNLLRLFLLRERAKKPSTDVQGISHAAVIGAGVMGSGIAQWISSRGVHVVLRDVSLDQLVRGMASVGSLYEDAVKRGHLTALEARDGKDRIFAAATDSPLRDVGMVIEAATEKLSLKQDIFRCLAAQVPRNTILATNTSALSISEIAAATPCPERVIGLHFFNPVHRMELVEVVAGPKTAPEVLVRAAEFARRAGKLPVIVKDSPGFIVNRILMPYLVEAVRLFDVGASAHEIDEAMLDFGMPMGPLRLLDEVGLDVAAHVLKTMAAHFGDRVSSPPLIERMIVANMLGKKTGRGFYDHSADKPNHDLDVMRSVHRHAHFTHDELTQRMSLLMVNEAARCVEEKIAAGPAVIDFAMVMGAGFAPFRGGPLRHADAVGVLEIVTMLQYYASTDPRFAPCARLKEVADRRSLFYPMNGGTV
jgi:3-hydroxyacyl-CoA dehydrogenase / enoyl-CoA hydratase / 3-hydroxybutyryl-CoA epimerase